jgi:hypothetical protein
MSLEQLAIYPLFTKEFLDWLTQAIPKERHNDIIYSAIIRGVKPEE